MKYRRLGRSGIKVSEVSLGSWLTYGNTTQKDTAIKTIDTAYELGINFFDTANTYGAGRAETVVGEALRKYRRDSFVLASKVWGKMGDGPNDRGLSRKHIMAQVEASLRRLGMEYMDIYYCHSVDPDTEIEETIRAMDDLIRQGKVLYMGVSNWSATLIAEALRASDKYLLDRIVVSQPVYNMFNRKIEEELMPYCESRGISQAVYSPLAQGVLTGKYTDLKEIPEDSRAANTDTSRFIERFLKEDVLKKVEKLKALADREGYKLSQLAIAWVLKNSNVASAIIGASRPEQVKENVKASDIVLTDDVLAEVENIL